MRASNRNAAVKLGRWLALCCWTYFIWQQNGCYQVITVSANTSLTEWGGHGLHEFPTPTALQEKNPPQDFWILLVHFGSFHQNARLGQPRAVLIELRVLRAPLSSILLKATFHHRWWSGQHGAGINESFSSPQILICFPNHMDQHSLEWWWLHSQKHIRPSSACDNTSSLRRPSIQKKQYLLSHNFCSKVTLKAASSKCSKWSVASFGVPIQL